MSSGAIPARDVRIDLWRGLCLIDVVLVHLAFNAIGFPEPVDQLIKHYTRFAAGGFVFLAGLTVAVVFGPQVAASPVARWNAYVRLWRRAGLLVLVDVGAAVTYRLLDVARWFPSDPDTGLTDALLAIVLLQRPGLTGGILLFYAALLTLMPALFEVQRRFGSPWLLGLSGAAYAVAISHGALRWPPYDFPLLHWQPLFVAGFLTARVNTWLQRGPVRRRRVWCGLAWMFFAVVFLAHHGPRFGFTWLAEFLPLDFRKTPLQPGALLWYLCSVQVVLATSSLLWVPSFARTPVAAGLTLLGRNSLLVYTAHVFTEILVLECTWALWPPGFVRVALAMADLVALMLLCAAVESGLHVRLARWTRDFALELAAVGLRRARWS